MENQMIVLVGINMLVGIMKVSVGNIELVCKGKSSKDQFLSVTIRYFYDFE